MWPTATTSPRTALAVAATYVVGFRAAFATDHLDARFDSPPPELDPATASAADIVTELATRAAIHADAHFVKYTLACIDAAHFDPMHAQFYLAAADAPGRIIGRRSDRRGSRRHRRGLGVGDHLVAIRRHDESCLDGGVRRRRDLVDVLLVGR